MQRTIIIHIIEHGKKARERDSKTCNARELNKRIKKEEKSVRVLEIKLIYLPPYSPDLNPIEYLWKSIKRVISISEIENKEELIEIVRNCFFSLTAGLYFARIWIPRFLYDKLSLLR